MSTGTAIEGVEIGDQLPSTHPDVSLERVRLFVQTAHMDSPRFSDDDHARREGLPGAIVPGIMSQALVVVMIHEWAPNARIRQLDTVFRNPVLVGSRPTCTGAVTNVDEDERLVELDVSMETEDGVTSVIGTAIVHLG